MGMDVDEYDGMVRMSASIDEFKENEPVYCKI